MITELRDLSALQLHSTEELEFSKSAFAKTADQCIEYEQKLRELDNIIIDLTSKRLEYKDDRRVDRIIDRLQCARNFYYKQVSKFTGFETILKEKRELLERKRTANLKKLEESKLEKVKASAEFELKKNAPVKSKLDLAPKKRGNPAFQKGKSNPYVKGKGENNNEDKKGELVDREVSRKKQK